MQVLLNRVRRFAVGGSLAVTSLAFALPAAAQAPTSITFFGDSFVDTGNGDILAALLLGTDLTPSPPYALGRASNGLVWADYLAQAFGRPQDAVASLLGGRNYAIGTATTGLAGYAGAPVGMLAQYAGQSGPLDPTGLYVLFGGANDLIGYAGLSGAALDAAIQTSVGNIGAIVQGLYLQGARNFLIPNLPDVGLTPYALNTPGASAVLSSSTLQFNAYLAQGLAGASATYTGANFMSLNLYNLYQNIRMDVANGGPNYGFTNTTIPCLVVPVSCSDAVFADALHPTTRAHKLIADAAYARVMYGVDVAVVPEPATVLLVGCGLLLCGVG
ncbi:MAG: SGNH/GDSL hydrolase family protein, partial [Gemmatimonadaceae bacterium]